MPKQKLGTGNKRAVLQRPATSYTSPNAIKLQQRRAAALEYRLQGHAYHRIAKALSCHPSTAHDYVVKAMRDMIPAETAQEVLRMELQRLDAMQSAVFADAANGDTAAIEITLRIMAHRDKLLGLTGEEKGGKGVHINIAEGPNAEDTGIQVTFVPSKWRAAEVADGGELIEGSLANRGHFLPVPKNKGFSEP
jgi:hypothetical protein